MKKSKYLAQEMTWLQELVTCHFVNFATFYLSRPHFDDKRSLKPLFPDINRKKNKMELVKNKRFKKNNIHINITGKEKKIKRS
jgi:hypothetical protein